MRDFERWLLKHKLLTKKAKHLRSNVVFATDGPWDLRDFATKSLHLSRCPKPSWFPQAYIDIRELVSEWYERHHETKVFENERSNQVSRSKPP
jgi:inhibitor of KinA sporulation pathway (predicted exonuclease)